MECRFLGREWNCAVSPAGCKLLPGRTRALLPNLEHRVRSDTWSHCYRSAIPNAAWRVCWTSSSGDLPLGRPKAHPGLLGKRGVILQTQSGTSATTPQGKKQAWVTTQLFIHRCSKKLKVATKALSQRGMLTRLAEYGAIV